MVNTEDNLEDVPLLEDSGQYYTNNKKRRGSDGQQDLVYGNEDIAAVLDKLSGSHYKEKTNQREGSSSRQKLVHYQQRTKCQNTLLFLSSVYLLFVAGGFLSGLGNIYADMIRQLGVSRTEASLVQSLTRATMFGGGIFVGMLLKRFGDSRCIFVGSILSCGGFVLSSFLTDIIAIAICTGVVAGSGLALLFLATYTSVSALFSHNPALGLNLVSIGVGFGNIAFPIGTELMIAFSNWNGTLLLCGGIMLNNLVGGAIIYVFMEKGQNKSKPLESQRVFDKALLKNSDYLILLPTFLLIGLILQVETYFIVDHMELLGFERQTGAYLLTISGIAGLITRISEGFLFLKFKSNVISHLIVGSLVLAVGHILFAILDDYWSLLIAMVLFGAGYSIFGALLAPLTVEVIGHDLFSVGFGILSTLLGVGYSVSSVVGGALYDITGSYKIVFFSAFVLTVVVIFIFIILFFKRRNVNQNGYTEI